MQRFPGIGARISERLRARGYEKNGRLDVARFCEEQRYRPQYVYAWLKDRVPSYDNLQRLADDLEIPVVELLFGDEVRRGDEDGNGGAAPAELRDRERRDDRRSRDPWPNGATRAPHILDVQLLRDATERLAALEAELSAVFDAFPDSSLWLDETGRIAEARRGRALAPNDEVAAHWVPGKAIEDIFGEQAGDKLRSAMQRALRVDDLTQVEFRTGTDDAARTWEARVLPVRRPRSTRLFVVLRDVSERARAEATLRESEARYRSVVEASRKGMCVYCDFAIVFANEAMARLFGYERAQEMVGADIRELIAPSDRERFEHAHGPTTKRGSGEYDAMQRSGRIIRIATLLSFTSSWRDRPARLMTMIQVPAPRH